MEQCSLTLYLVENFSLVIEAPNMSSLLPIKRRLTRSNFGDLVHAVGEIPPKRSL